jgi:hypothetical protein
MPKTGIPFLPDLDAFYPLSMDIWANNTFFPPSGHAPNVPRTSGVTALVCCDFSQASRTRISGTGSFNYTHVFIIDPTIEVHDAYTGDTITTVGFNDWIACPAGQITNWLEVVFSFIANMPQLGKRKIIVADRHLGNQLNNAF